MFVEVTTSRDESHDFLNSHVTSTALKSHGNVGAGRRFSTIEQTGKTNKTYGLKQISSVTKIELP